MIVEVSGSKPEEWDQFVIKHASGNPAFSCSQWAEVLRGIPGCEPRFVSGYDDSRERTAAWLVFVNEPSAFRHGWKRRVCRTVDRLTREAIWPAAPVVVPGGSADANCALLDVLRRMKRVFRIAGGPWIAGVEPFDRMTWWATYRVDCEGSEGALWSRLSGSARKAIRRAREHEVTVRRIRRREELDAYARLVDLAPAYTRPGRVLSRLEDFRAVWDRFRAVGHLEFFVAEHGGRIIGGLGVIGCGTYVTEIALCQSPRTDDVRLNGQDLIKWEIIRWANASGIRTFDLAGVSPRPRTTKEARIRQFKAKWGGAYVEYPVVRGHWISGWK